MKRIAFTIVLNGMPFIKKQAEIIPHVFDEWYIVEGAVLPTHDTAWCHSIDSKYYTSDTLSVDGTSEFLDSIASDTIHIIRKNAFWNGKLEMCNSFSNKLTDCILMQFDVDEFWDINTLKSVLTFSENNTGFDGMLFRCNFFVGPNLVVTSQNCYSDNVYEWCRLWKINQPTTWISHEPPRLKGLDNFLNKDFTSSQGWVFNHYAYILEEQLKFKENFYGYTNATENWKRLQLSKTFPCQLKDYLPWVRDNTTVNLK